jgi:two-component system phosphate regulon sensor histidine kinase PhoR
MRNQTEKILQMAALEDRDYELKLSEVDLHEVIRLAIDNVALQVEHRHGRITCDLGAKGHMITADKVHVAAIVHNLLDNANKYSPEAPVIRVATSSNAAGILVSIKDQGMGIQDEDRKMVFDKYFRVSSGNIHDVKGFGLGLSYVKLMVAAHGGEVSLESVYGKGTTVRLLFPFQGRALG